MLKTFSTGVWTFPVRVLLKKLGDSHCLGQNLRPWILYSFRFPTGTTEAFARACDHKQHVLQAWVSHSQSDDVLGRLFTHVTANSQSAGNGFVTKTVATVIS